MFLLFCFFMISRKKLLSPDVLLQPNMTWLHYTKQNWLTWVRSPQQHPTGTRWHPKRGKGDFNTGALASLHFSAENLTKSRFFSHCNLCWMFRQWSARHPRWRLCVDGSGSGARTPDNPAPFSGNRTPALRSAQGTRHKVWFGHSHWHRGSRKTIVQAGCRSHVLEYVTFTHITGEMFVTALPTTFTWRETQPRWTALPPCSPFSPHPQSPCLRWPHLTLWRAYSEECLHCS